MNLAYELLDSGDGRKLERVGPYRVERQASAALWRKSLGQAEWKDVDAVHHRSESGGGHWEQKRKMPESWTTEIGGLSLKTKLTSFGHLGFFPEQSSEWNWFRSLKVDSLKILNLFAYTGGSTLSLALRGAEVTHVDAAKGIVDWSRQNAELNQVPDGKIRLIVEDCLSFLKREQRRGKRYDGVVLDPPSYGRGPAKEVFKIEDHIGELLKAISEILVPEPALIHLSCHSSGFSPEVLKNLLWDYLPSKNVRLEGMTVEAGEMLVRQKSSERQLPSGTRCRFFKNRR